MVGPADETRRGEAPRRQVGEEHVVGNESGHGDHAPAGRIHQHVAEPIEVGNLIAGDLEARQPLHELVGSTAGQKPGLAAEQGPPDAVLRRAIGAPVLLDSMVVGTAGHGPSSPSKT